MIETIPSPAELIGRSFRWTAHPKEPIFRLSEVIGGGALASILLRDPDGGIDPFERTVPVAMFRDEIRTGKLVLLDDVTQTGPTLFETMAPDEEDREFDRATGPAAPRVVEGPAFIVTPELAARWGEDLQGLVGVCFMHHTPKDSYLNEVASVGLFVGKVRISHPKSDTRESIALGTFFRMIESGELVEVKPTADPMPGPESYRDDHAPLPPLDIDTINAARAGELGMTSEPTGTRPSGMGFGGMERMIEQENARFEARSIAVTGHRADECPQSDHEDCHTLADARALVAAADATAEPAPVPPWLTDPAEIEAREIELAAKRAEREPKRGRKPRADAAPVSAPAPFPSGASEVRVALSALSFRRDRLEAELSDVKAEMRALFDAQAADLERQNQEWKTLRAELGVA